MQNSGQIDVVKLNLLFASETVFDKVSKVDDTEYSSPFANNPGKT